MPSFLHSPPKDIYWMSSPLKVDSREDWAKQLASKSYVPKQVTKFVDPSKERRKGGYGFFPMIKHWTLEIDGKCYELWPDTKKRVIDIKARWHRGVPQGTDMCRPQVKDSAEWWEQRNMHGIKPDYRKIGQTKMSHKQIEKAYKDIWINFNKQGYEFFTQNCQNFTAMLYQCIALDIPECERHLWEVMPEPASHTLAAASKVALVSQPYITASLEAAVGGVGVMEAGAAGAGATGAGVTGTTVATTGTTAVATTTATTEGGAVATTMGTTGTQAAGATTQTAAASTSHGAASVTATKGTGVGAGKAGVGAKFGGLGGKLAVVGHGAGATKAGLVAKGAIGLAMLHPVVGTATACGLLYVAARGRRDKKWKRKARREGEEGDDDSDSEPSVEDMLGAEQELLEMAENPTEEQDQRIAEYLAEGLEDLHLTQVTTEPAMMPEEMSQVEEIVPAGGVPRRTQTIV